MTTAIGDWKGRQAREIELPSGARVKVRLVNVLTLVHNDRVPNDLLDVAKDYIVDGLKNLKPERARAWQAFGDWVASQTVVEPAITLEDIDALPLEDVEYLRGIAFRAIPMPALADEVDSDEPRTVDDLRPFRDETARDGA